MLPEIISQDQQGYLKGRNICFNIRQIQDVIDYAEKLQINGAILFLDFKKAFDTIDRIFLIETLQKFGFREQFIIWIKTIYNDIFSRIINYGWKSDKIELKRGVRQGCPLSALLFILVAEIRSTRSKQNENINGISFEVENDQKVLKLTQLADDTTLFVKDETDTINALNLVEEFSKVSGLYLNRKKTEGLWLKNTKQTIVGGIKWSNEIKALGIWFGNDKRKCEELNWDEKINKCSKLIDSWKKRYLTLYGKITVIKYILLPLFNYLFQSLVIPKHMVKKINTMFYGFLWDGKSEKK